MLDTAEGTTKVKASGGIRTYVDAQKFIDLGCHRLGVGFSTTPSFAGIAQLKPQIALTKESLPERRSK